VPQDPFYPSASELIENVTGNPSAGYGFLRAGIEDWIEKKFTYKSVSPPIRKIMNYWLKYPAAYVLSGDTPIPSAELLFPTQ
jgi:hypothetical protein